VLTVDEREGVLVVALDRPERRNAMVPELMVGLAEAIRQAGHAAEIGQLRALVLTGTEPAFCVGADLKWLAALPDPGEGVASLVAVHHEAVRALLALPIPVVCALNGAAAGGGLSLALACDLRVASTRATITAAYFRLGLPPDGGCSALLTRSIGSARAMELLLTNRTLSADEAFSWGLVNEVVSPENLLERACDLAAGFVAVPPVTLLAARALLDRAVSDSILAVLDAEEVAIREAARSSHFRTALSSFLSRR
jgi:2-(1,2-epoxy-1,2-dihydrophenyl)acetyl-CoA isomerase